MKTLKAPLGSLFSPFSLLQSGSSPTLSFGLRHLLSYSSQQLPVSIVCTDEDTVCTALCRHSLPWHGQQRAIVRIQTAQWLFWALRVWANEVLCLLSLSFPICRVNVIQCPSIVQGLTGSPWRFPWHQPKALFLVRQSVSFLHALSSNILWSLTANPPSTLILFSLCSRPRNIPGN